AVGTDLAAVGQTRLVDALDGPGELPGTTGGIGDRRRVVGEGQRGPDVTAALGDEVVHRAEPGAGDAHVGRRTPADVVDALGAVRQAGDAGAGAGAAAARGLVGAVAEEAVDIDVDLAGAVAGFPVELDRAVAVDETDGGTGGVGKARVVLAG